MAIQVYLTAAVMNLKRLAAFGRVCAVIVRDGAGDVFIADWRCVSENQSRIVRLAA